MKMFQRIVLVFFVILSMVVIGLYLSGNSHVFRGVLYTYLDGKSGPTIDDGLKFQRDTLPVADPQPWPISESINKTDLPQQIMKDLEVYDPVAFLVIDQDSIVYERYWKDYSEQSYTNSFSMAKSLVGLAIGVAIKEGHIKGIDQEAGDYFPHLKESPGKALTIEDLLQMSSGIDFGESYTGAFGYVAKAYYGYDIASLTMKYKVSSEPGELFKYQGGNTQLLAMIIEKATGESFVDYFNSRIWSKIGAVNDAWWTLDESGMVRASCCFYSNARDYARIAKLMMNKGKWKGQELIPSDYVAASLQPVMNKNSDGEEVDYYGYQWWLGEYEDSELYALRGLQGQYIIAIPDRDLIIVRLGHKRSDQRRNHMPLDMYDVLNAGCYLDQ